MSSWLRSFPILRRCLGIQHAEAAFVDGLCVRSQRITMAALRSRLSLLTGMGGAPSVITRAGFSATSREPSASALGDLRVTVRAFPPGQSPRTFHSSRSSCSVQLPGDSAVPSHGLPSVSFGAPIEDQMLIAASGDGQSSSEDEDLVGLPPTGVAAAAESDPELMAVLSRGAVRSGWRRAHLPVLSPRGEMIGSSAQAVARDHALPWFLSSRKCTRSWWSRGRPLFTARSGSSASPILATLDGGAARGYVDIPQVENAVAVHLYLQNAATWRNCPSLPSKACKLTAAFTAKAYSAAGQAASALHAMAILRVHQAKALKCTRVVPTRGWSRNCARRLTLPYGWRKSQRSPSGRRYPHFWSKSTIYGSALLRGAISTKCAFSMFSSPRLDGSATLSRTVTSSSRQYRSRLRLSNTSCPGVMHHLPPLRRRASPSLLVAVGALLCPPELLRPLLNRHLGRRVEPLAGARRPPCSSWPRYRPGRR